MGGRNRQEVSTRLVYFIIALVLVLIGFIGIGLFFHITTIQVEGTQIYTPAEVVTASGLQKDSSMLFMNESSIAVRIRNAFTYIDEVQIIKEMPGTVRIRVTETPPLAYVENGGAYWILAANGKVLERADTVAGQTLIALQGVEVLLPTVGEELALGTNSAQKRGSLVEALTALQETGLYELVSWLDLSSATDVRFFFDNRLTVSLGRSDNALDKLWLLERIIDEHPQGTAKVDLSAYPKANYIPT